MPDPILGQLVQRMPKRKKRLNISTLYLIQSSSSKCWSIQKANARFPLLLKVVR